MSPRAAWRLESLGFVEVYDYVAGKVDWIAAGLPTIGPGAASLRAGTVVRRDVATCRLDEPQSALHGRLAELKGDRWVVLNNAGVVMGILDRRSLADAQDPALSVAAVMRPGPTTVRASEGLGPLVARMTDRDVASVLVTDPEGRLIGVLMRDDADAALEGER